MPRSRRLFQQIGMVSLITGATQLAFLVANLLLARAMTQEEYGRVSLANILINLTAYLGLVGLNSAVVRAIPREELQVMNWRADVPRVAGVALVIVLTITGLAGILYRFSPAETALMALAGWFFALSVAGSALLMIERRFASSQLWLYLWRILLLLGSGLLLGLGVLHTRAVLVIYALAGAVQVGGLWVTLRAHPGGDRPLPVSRIVREGLLFFGLFLTSTLMLRLDAFLLAGIVNPAALGRYAAASNIALTGYGVLSLGVSQVLMPRVASGEPLHLKRLLGLLGVGGSLAALALTLFGTPLIHALYANRYPGDYRPLIGLLCAAGMTQVMYVVPSALLGVRAPLALLRAFLLVNVVSVAINGGLNLWLIPRWGLEGAAVATLLSWVWRLVWAVVMVRRMPGPSAKPVPSGSPLPG